MRGTSGNRRREDMTVCLFVKLIATVDFKFGVTRLLHVTSSEARICRR
jgi:hypothetical protein